MLLAAREQHCLREVLVIASALSVQDPRERPLEAQEAADQAHRRFADDKSDFLSLLKLWDFVHERIDHKKSNRKLTEDLRSHFLSPRRVREWIDVHGQLAALASEQGWRVNPSPATLRAAAPGAARRTARATSAAACSMLTAANRRTPARAASSSTSGPVRRWRRRRGAGSWRPSWSRPRACSRARSRRSIRPGSSASARTC